MTTVVKKEAVPEKANNDSLISPEAGAMAQLIVRNIEAEVKAKLRRRASRHGHSVEEEVRDILRNAVKDEARRRPKGWAADRRAVRRDRAGQGYAGIMGLSR